MLDLTVAIVIEEKKESSTAVDMKMFTSMTGQGEQEASIGVDSITKEHASTINVCHIIMPSIKQVYAALKMNTVSNVRPYDVSLTRDDVTFPNTIAVELFTQTASIILITGKKSTITAKA